MIYDDFDVNKVSHIKLHIEDNSVKIEDIVTDIIQPYVKDLDAYVLFIKDVLKDGNNPPTVSELEDFCMNLSTFIYFASGMQEQLGIRDDIAKAVYKNTFNETRDNENKGTVADKNSIAELASQQELIVSVCYTRAYRIVKVKVEAAQELLASCKKVISRRIAEMELTKISG